MTPSNCSCLCGALRYRVTGPLRPVVACHCARCRKTNSHYIASTSTPRDSAEIAGGLRWFASSKTTRSGFFPVCGSNLFWNGAGRNLSTQAVSFDSPIELALAGHIFTADKGDYYRIADGTPRAPNSDPDLPPVVP